MHDQLSASDRFSKRTKHLKYSELGDLVKPHRFLAREGALREYSVKQNKTKTREFFLFNDLLLKAKRTSERSLQLRGKHPIRTHRILILAHPSLEIQIDRNLWRIFERHACDGRRRDPAERGAGCAFLPLLLE